MNPLRMLVAANALAAATLLTGCVVAPMGPYPAEAVVPVAPPPPRVEVYGPPPMVGYMWLPGYWNWYGGRHVWIAGRWDAPRPGYYWHPHRWVPATGGYRIDPGRWERGRG